MSLRNQTKENKMKAEEALGLAIELVSDRLDLIRQRELDERDGIEEAKLKLADKTLCSLWEAATADLLEGVIDESSE